MITRSAGRALARVWISCAGCPSPIFVWRIAELAGRADGAVHLLLCLAPQAGASPQRHGVVRRLRPVGRKGGYNVEDGQLSSKQPSQGRRMPESAGGKQGEVGGAEDPLEQDWNGAHETPPVFRLARSVPVYDTRHTWATAGCRVSIRGIPRDPRRISARESWIWIASPQRLPQASIVTIDVIEEMRAAPAINVSSRVEDDHWNRPREASRGRRREIDRIMNALLRPGGLVPQDPLREAQWILDTNAPRG